MKLWERTLLFRLFALTGFLLFSLFLLYAFVDLAVHSGRFFSGSVQLHELLLYYLYSFSSRFDLFCSLSFLLSLLALLCTLSPFELISLQMSGLSKQRLLRPFLSMALLLSLCSLTNHEWFLPRSLNAIDAFRDLHAKRKKGILREHIRVVALADGSELVFQTFDPQKQTLSDLYWIRTPKELWHMSSLELRQSPPTGRFVDRLVRNQEGIVLKEESWDQRSFPELGLISSQDLQKFIPFDRRPLSSLLTQEGTDDPIIRAQLHYKTTFSLFPLLIALAVPPICLRFSRTRPTFLIVAGSLFALLTLFTIQDGMLILAENRMLAPALALWGPWVLNFLLGLIFFCAH